MENLDHTLAFFPRDAGCPAIVEVLVSLYDHFMWLVKYVVIPAISIDLIMVHIAWIFFSGCDICPYTSRVCTGASNLLIFINIPIEGLLVNETSSSQRRNSRNYKGKVQFAIYVLRTRA